MTSHINQLISIADKRGSGHMFSQWETNSHTDTHSLGMIMGHATWNQLGNMQQTT